MDSSHPRDGRGLSNGDEEKAQFQAAIELADRLFDLPEIEREPLLESAEPGVRAEARKLLSADALVDDPLSQPAGALIPSALSTLATPRAQGAQEGMRFGPFRLLSLLGKGGMGEVWVAERVQGDFRQRVALKLLRAHGDAEGLEARFRQERRILAQLSHPRIATFLDGGVSQDGRPWLAMELVVGSPLTTHCDDNELPIDDRLRLFAEVCDAVQFAHRNLVVHRDLKPSNILVGAAGEVKLLDFGIAKILSDDENKDASVFTRGGERPMTPDYAAPEQVAGEKVTTATDVWSLGIILHELLTGVRPYRARSAAQMERAILQAEPPRPSASVEGKARRRRLRGDLDAIVLKALRREPENRYASAEALASDVRRHVKGLPVAARGDATTYLLRSFLRRYRVGVGFSTFALVALIAGLAGTLWQAHRARDEARKAEQAQELLLLTNRGLDPTTQRGQPVDQREVMSRDEERATRELADQPELLARILLAFAQGWYNQGVFARARPPAERALALERTTRGPRSHEEARTLVVLGDIDFAERDLEGAGRAYSDAHAIFVETEGQDSLAAVRALGKLAGTRAAQGDFSSAEALGGEQLASLDRVLGKEDPERLTATSDHALRLALWGQSDQARQIDEGVIGVMGKVLGGKHPDTLIVRLNLANVLVDLGRAPEAEPLARQVETDMVEVFGENYSQLAAAHRARGRALDGLGRADEALALFDRAIRLWTKAYSERSVWVTQAMSDKATALRHLGRPAEAEGVIRQGLDTQVALYGEDFIAARMRSVLGAVLVDEGRAKEAAAELGRALGTQEKILCATSPELGATRRELARANALVVGRDSR